AWSRHRPTRYEQTPSTVRSESHAGSPSVHTCIRLVNPYLSRNGVYVPLTPGHSARQSVATLPPPGIRGAWKPAASAAGCSIPRVENPVTPLVVAVWRAVFTVVGSGVYPAPTQGPSAPQLSFSEHMAPPTMQVPVLKRAITSAASSEEPGLMPAIASSVGVY